MKVKELGQGELCATRSCCPELWARLHVHEKMSCSYPLGGDFQSPEAQRHNASENCPAALAVSSCVSSNQGDSSSPAFSALLIQDLLKLLLTKQLRTELSSVCLCSFLCCHAKGSEHLSLSSSALIPARSALPLHNVGLTFF